MKAIGIGIISSFFFAFTFVLNRAMELDGGSWVWSASLRYLFMVPLLAAIVAIRGNIGGLFRVMRQHPKQWFVWSFVGFVLFYAPICFASSFGPGWLIASTWQMTIIAGILVTPLFYKTVNGQKVRERLPVRGLMMSSLILIGVVLMQAEHAASLGILTALGAIIPVAIAAFAYPLGNRKMMELCNGELDSFQRVLGMTIASLPIWMIMAGYEFAVSGPPSSSQVLQCFLIAISSGVIATVLFFLATDLAKGDVQKLAAVEATQAGEILFALAGEMWLLSAPLPSALSWFGILVVAGGMILHSYSTHKQTGMMKKSSSLSS